MFIRKPLVALSDRTLRKLRDCILTGTMKKVCHILSDGCVELFHATHQDNWKKYHLPIEHGGRTNIEN